MEMLMTIVVNYGRTIKMIVSDKSRVGDSCL